MNKPDKVRLKVANFLSEERFSEALDLLRQVEGERGLTPGELVTKGRCIQITPAESGGDLLDAEQAFKDALEIDPEYVPALLDLAFFYFAVAGNVEIAMPLFEKAIEIGRTQLTEAALGKCGCLEELSSSEAAASFLNSLNRNALLPEKLDEEKQGWLR